MQTENKDIQTMEEFLNEKDEPIKFKKDSKGNYCPCGNYGKPNKPPCTCTVKELIEYQKKHGSK